jgi:lipopolysaccharide/colanic/teichoic acid biosynthesis glycosyltransferase
MGPEACTQSFWQVGGRNKAISFEDVVAYDTEYIKNWNLMPDIRIFLRVLGVIIFPKNNGRK